MYEDLYENNKGLLVTMAAKYKGCCEADRAVSKEDLMQAGFLALVRAWQTYDPDKGKSWGAWAIWHIRKEYRSLFGLRDGRFTRCHTGAESLDRKTSEGSDETLMDMLADETLPDPDEALLKEEQARALRQAVGRLKDDRQRQVAREMLLKGKSIRKTAQRMGVTPSRVCRLRDRARENLLQDQRLRREFDLDERTRFFARKSLAAFRRDHTSVVEEAVIWREGQRARQDGGPRQT